MYVWITAQCGLRFTFNYAVIISPPVSQVVTSGEMALFNCYGRGVDVYWLINESHDYPSFRSKGFNFTEVRYRAANPQRELDRWNLTITVLASLAPNNSAVIDCIAIGWIRGQSDRVTVQLIIAGE